MLPVGPDLRHGWYVLVDTDVGAYEVAIDADTGEVLQLVSPQFGRDSGRFTPDDGFTPPPLPYGIIIGNGARIGNGAAATGVRLAGVSLVGGRLVRP